MDKSSGRTALLDLRQASEADRLTVAAGTSTAELRSAAGKAVAGAIEGRWSARPVIVLCGPGNNGGDGFVAARRLSDDGWPVRVALLGANDPLAGEARYHADVWRGAVEPLRPAVLEGAALVVDAIHLRRWAESRSPWSRGGHAGCRRSPRRADRGCRCSERADGRRR